MAGSFCFIIKTHSGRSLNVILKETIDTGGRKWRDCYVSPRRCQHQTVWCVCGSFYKAFFSSKRRRKCLPSLSSPGARVSCGKCTGPFYECWRTEAVGVAERCFLIRSIPDPQTGRLWCAVNSDQLFKCEVRANSAVGFPRWMVKRIHFSQVLHEGGGGWGSHSHCSESKLFKKNVFYCEKAS